MVERAELSPPKMSPPVSDPDYDRDCIDRIADEKGTTRVVLPW